MENNNIKIQVLGPGCASCKKLFELTKQAVHEMGLKTEVEYVTDIQKIIEMGIMQSPILAIDGKPVLTGAVSDIQKIKNVLISKKAPGGEDNKPECSCGGKC